MKVEPIQFGRGNARIFPNSKRALQELATTLKSFPQYYLRVVGHTRQEGDPAANRILALQRAEAAAESLRNFGIANHRIAPLQATKPPPRCGEQQHKVLHLNSSENRISRDEVTSPLRQGMAVSHQHASQ